MHNGPTIKPIERRAGIIENMTPDMACIVGGLGADHSSREMVRALWRTASSRRAARSWRSTEVSSPRTWATKVVELEAPARATEAIPGEVASVSGGLDRMSVRVNEPSIAENMPPPRRTEPYVRQAPPPQEAHWRKAWAGSVTLHDRDGKELGTRMYGAEGTRTRTRSPIALPPTSPRSSALTPM